MFNGWLLFGSIIFGFFVLVKYSNILQAKFFPWVILDFRFSSSSKETTWMKFIFACQRKLTTGNLFWRRRTMEIGRIYLFVFSASLTTRLLVKTNLFSCVIVSFGFSLSHNTFYMKQFHRRPTLDENSTDLVSGWTMLHCSQRSWILIQKKPNYLRNSMNSKPLAKETLYLTKTTILYLLNNYFRKKGKQ